MTKVIRVKDATFEKLISASKWSDTMDDIICKLITTRHGDQDCKKNYSPTESLSVSEF